MLSLLRFAGGVEHAPRIESWLDEQPRELGSIARTWFTRMRLCGTDVLELMHDGFATVCVGDAPFAYVGVFKQHVNIGFFHGSALPDPASLLEGTGKHGRHVKLRPGVAFDEPALVALIVAAYRDIIERRTIAE